ncbi:MAG: GAF domain-containing sensor histidine kinase [Gemmatimonadaceae bacterium]
MLTLPTIDWAKELAAAADATTHLDADRRASGDAGETGRLVQEIVVRMTRLLDVTTALADATSSADVAGALIHQGLDVLEASAGLVTVVEAGGPLALAWRASTQENESDTPPRVFLGGLGMIAEALHGRQAVWIESTERFREFFPQALDRRTPDVPTKCILSLPLVHGSDLIGALVLGFESASAFGAVHRSFAMLLAQSAAAALSRAGECERERDGRREAESAAHAREEVLAIVAHDLRNPLGVIGGTIDLLRDFDVAPAQRERLLMAAGRSVQQMKRLVNDLLDVTRYENGRLAIDPQEIEVAALIEDALDGVRQSVADRQIAIVASPVASDLRLRGDAGRLSQVLSNLLGNAIKFTPDGGRISLRVWRDGDKVTFEVADTGPGISAEHRERLFDRFWQARAADVRGIGLGLAISRAIVEAHGGRIWVESEIGVGSRFTFSVPAAVSRDDLEASLL